MIRQRDGMNTNNSMKWKWFIVPKIVEQINEYLFICTYKSNTLKIGMNEMRVNDSEMSLRWNNEAWSISCYIYGANVNVNICLAECFFVHIVDVIVNDNICLAGCIFVHSWWKILGDRRRMYLSLWTFSWPYAQNNTSVRTETTGQVGRHVSI